ncbi:ABC transporter permease [Prosthecodimorpha staleyi]|uniref:ABC transporter permease n=1 Tax=Prosthecodimorpha staleyi TaxID=2840188 RepID=A0A947DB24_9HYPH|nr:ABC transporter permease [Prosthecodimorpha staleyi]MBT9290789.1 ABC transporter permease [Prosthecodimorpha staleyi]
MARPKSTRSPYGSPLAMRFRNVAALLSREVHRSSEGRLGYASTFIEPLALIIGLSLIRYEFHPIPPLGNSMALFFLQGVVVFYAFNKTEAAISGAMSKNKMVLNFPIITPFDIYLAQFVMIVTNMIIIYHIFLFSHNFFMKTIYPEQVLWPEDILRVYEAIFMAGVYGFVIGVLNASLEVYLPWWDRFYSVLRRAQFIFSGKMFVVDYMPPTMREIIAWNPLMHPIELARSGFYNFYESKTMDLSYFYGTMLGMAVIALSLERFARARMTTES